MRIENNRPTEHANDHRQAGSGVEDQPPGKIEKDSPQMKERLSWFEHQGTGGGRAQQGKGQQCQHYAYLKRAAALALPTHSAQIPFSMRPDDAGEVRRHFESGIIESHVESAKQLALSAKFRGAIRAGCQVPLKVQERLVAQLTVEICGDIFELTFTWMVG